MVPSLHSKGRSRRGQALVEFAIVALVVYLLLGGILTFGQLFYCNQTIQQAADRAAKETSRTPLPAATTTSGSGISLTYVLWGDAETDPSLLAVRKSLFDGKYLRFDLTENVRPGESVLDVIRRWPIINQMLYSVMIVEREHQGRREGPEHEYLWYPGAVPCRDSAVPGAIVWCVARIDGRSSDGAETITWIPVIEEIASPADQAAGVSPFSVASPEAGLVSLRINYGCQSATMSAFPPPKTWPPEPVGSPWAATTIRSRSTRRITLLFPKWSRRTTLARIAGDMAWVSKRHGPGWSKEQTLIRGRFRRGNGVCGPFAA